MAFSGGALWRTGGLLRVSLHALTRSGNGAIGAAAEADASRAAVGYIVTDADGHPRGLGLTLHEAASDAEARGYDGPASTAPASPMQYQAAIAALEG